MHRNAADIIAAHLDLARMQAGTQADADLARIRQGATPAGDADPYRVTGAEEVGGEPETGAVELEDTYDRDRPED